MSKNKSLVRLQYLKDASETFEERKRNAKAEALLQATLAVASMREDLARMFWEAHNSGASIADLSNVSGYSRATVYRLLDEHVENTGGQPGALLDAVERAKKQRRFVFAGISQNGDIMVNDSENAEGNGIVYFGDWKNDWEHSVYGARNGKRWVTIPELDLLVEQIVSGGFVPEDKLPLVDAKTAAMITRVQVAETIGVDWD